MCRVFNDGSFNIGSVVRAFAHCAMGRRIDPSWVDPLSYFSFQPVLHDLFNKGYPVLSCLWDGAYKRTLAVIRKSSLCGSSGFPLSLSEWSLTICLTPYNLPFNIGKILPSVDRMFGSVYCKLLV